MQAGAATYPPLNTLKPITEAVWIVDGPTIRFGPPGLRMPFPTRMTIVRLGDGGLFVHSPTHLTKDLRAELQALGPVRFIVAPNRIHYWWVPSWRIAYPEAEIWLAPRIREQAGEHIAFPTREIAGESGYPWDPEIRTLPIEGSFMTEVEFFHITSRTLVLTDFIENFEPRKLNWWRRIVARLGGVLAPHGAMPRDMRLTFSRQRPALKRAVETMIGWAPERVIIAHGRWFERDGQAILQRSFNWLLDRP
ncbi:DUF4336 domain-containing protein [uncultured Nitratireductor sp.]|uniref:DUF4336 domain-containing protein n=1 Tax=uncultured Nitratireductor sp. TaxID=520953 RepID=UPI0025E7F1FA|nr:DUF4336 domain-containing protein [uncultured Nitratireductor sp.]